MLPELNHCLAKHSGNHSAQGYPSFAPMHLLQQKSIKGYTKIFSLRIALLIFAASASTQPLANPVIVLLPVP